MDASVFDIILKHFDIYLLLSVRMIGLFATAPVWSNKLVPVQLRVAISFVVALVILPLFQNVTIPSSLGELIALAIQEIFVGMVIGFIAVLSFATIQFAGQLLDINMGLAMINVLDPVSSTQMPIMGNFLYILSLLIFFSVNGHHMLLQAVFDSYVYIPIGALKLTPTLNENMITLGAHLFLIGFQIASPVLAALFLTTLALGILNRVIPQMNVFIIGTPIQLAVGVVMLIVVLPLFVSFLQVIFRGMAGDILTTVRLMKG
jgi:flagellar biosynthetic protein FliR